MAEPQKTRADTSGTAENKIGSDNSSEDMMSPMTGEPAISIIKLITGAKMAMKV